MQPASIWKASPVVKGMSPQRGRRWRGRHRRARPSGRSGEAAGDQAVVTLPGDRRHVGADDVRCAPRGYGIACTTIRPGIIRTDMTAVAREALRPPDRRRPHPDRPLGRARRCRPRHRRLACGDIPFTTGDAFHIDGGLHIQKL